MAYSALAVHYLIYFTFLGQRIYEETILGMVKTLFLKNKNDAFTIVQFYEQSITSLDMVN